MPGSSPGITLHNEWRGIMIKNGFATLLIAIAAAVCAASAKADVLTLTSSQIQDNGQLAVKNACADKQRSPNCVGENISPPLAWSGAPDTTKSYALTMV